MQQQRWLIYPQAMCLQDDDCAADDYADDDYADDDFADDDCAELGGSYWPTGSQ